MIDFVMELFDLDFRAAIKRLDGDFGLGLTNSPPDREAIRERRRKQIRARAQKDAACREYRRKLDEIRACIVLVRHAAPDETGEFSDYRAPAFTRLPELDYWFETHPSPF